MSMYPILFITLAATAQAADLKVTHHSLRQDRLVVSKEQWQWNEGWGRVRQFFPRYFNPAATAHLFVQNTGEAAIDITDVRYNGRPIAEVCTRPDYAGPVIWYRSNPETLEPGRYGMIYVRLRDVPDGPFTLSVAAGGESVTAEYNDDDRDKIRFGSVGFNDDIDRVYAYVESWCDDQLELDRVRLDGVDVTARCELVNANFTSGPALIELALPEPLKHGSFHVIEAATALGPVAVSQVRARDARFRLGIWPSDVEKCHAKFFNTLYNPHNYPTDAAWWESSTENRFGFALTGTAETEAQVRAIAMLPADRLIYTNIDEPDAHEPAGLPYMARSGINVMHKVEPTMRMQRRLDPHHDTTFVCNRTYAPLNYLHYGEVPDIFITDCYIPVMWMGYDLWGVPMQMRTAAAAAAPRPTDMMIWGCMNTGYPMKRSPTPHENDMVVHYAIAEGAKGIHYFCDWNSYPVVAEGGYFIGVSSTNMQWKNIGRMNAQITRIAPLLSKGHPFQIAASDNAQLYVRSLLCGQDDFVVVMVNRNHRIHSATNNRGALQPYIYPVNEATVTLDLPPWFRARSAVRVAWDKVEPVVLEGTGRAKSLTVHDLMTSMVLVVSQDAQIADKLTVDAERIALLHESEKPTYVTDNAPIPAVSRPESRITLDAATLAGGALTLDLTDPEILAKAWRIHIDGGELRQAPGEWLGLFTPEDWHGDASIEFRIESDRPLNKVVAELESRTPNIAACANNSVGISFDGGKNFAHERSFKMQWPGHGKLTMTRDAEADKPISSFVVQVRLRDPGIVRSDEATNLANLLTIGWD